MEVFERSFCEYLIDQENFSRKMVDGLFSNYGESSDVNNKKYSRHYVLPPFVTDTNGCVYNISLNTNQEVGNIVKSYISWASRQACYECLFGMKKKQLKGGEIATPMCVVDSCIY